MSGAAEPASPEWPGADAVAASGQQGVPASVLDRPVPVSKVAMPVAALGTLALHAGLVALALFVGARSAAVKPKPVAITEMVEVELEPASEPEPPPEPEPEPEAEPPAPEPVSPPRPAPKPIRQRAADAPREAPPPAAAQAGAALTAPDEFVDFGETLVVGQGDAHTGGVTEAGGTSKTAVRDERARAGGVVGGTGTKVEADLSRPPQLAGGMQWDCPFPEEAYEEDVGEGVVTLKVEVGPDGKVLDVHVVKDPGYGFGREARRCALRKRWAAGLDRAGRPTRALALVNVRFVPPGR